MGQKGGGKMAKTSEEILGWHCRYVRALTVGGDRSRFILHFTEHARVRAGADVKSLIICFIINLYFTFHFTLRNAARGRSQSLAPFGARRRKFTPSPHQDYIPPVFWPFFRWGVLGPRTSGAVFWARLCPWPIFGTRRPPAKSGAIPSPADELRPRPPPRL